MNILLLTFYVIVILVNFIYGLYRTGNQRTQPIILLQRSNKEKRIVLSGHFFSLLLIIVLLIIVCSNNDNPDYRTYEWIYSGRVTIEKGWMILQGFAKNAGMSFSQFRTIIVTISYALLWIGLLKLKLNENLILAVFSFYPFAMDAIQTRNFLSLSLFLIIFNKIVFTESFKDKIIFALIILVASSIQSMFPVYLIFLIFDLKRPLSKKNVIIIFLISMISFSLIVIMKFYPDTVIEIGRILFKDRKDKFNKYIVGNVGMGFILYGMAHLFFAISMLFALKNNDRLSKNEMTISKSIYTADIVLLSMLPLLILNIEFYRIYRNMCILNYLSLNYLLVRRNDIYKLLGLFTFLIAFCMYLYLDYFNSPERFEFVFLPFFK